MEISARQAESWQAANRRINLWSGPVRSGKTVACNLSFLDYIERFAPPGELYIIGRTFQAVRRNVISPMERMIGRDLSIRSGDNSLSLWGRTIYVVGMHDAKSELVIRGSTSAGTYGDEVSTWPESGFKMAMTRLSLEGSRFFGTTNPDNPRHYLKREYIDRARDLDMAHFTWGLRENPFLPKAYTDALEREYTGLFYKRFILGLWVAAEGAVYGMLDDDVHVIDQLPEPDEYIIGVDYGTSLPMVFLLIGVKYRHNMPPIAWIEREHYYDPVVAMASKTDGEHASDLHQFILSRDHRDVRVVSIYCDPSAASFRVACAKAGIEEIKDVDTADNRVCDGISTVSTMFAQGRLKIHRRCEQSLTEVYGYVWDPKAQLRGIDAPKKEGDHAMDALRYALHTHFGEDSEAAAYLTALKGVRDGQG